MCLFLCGKQPSNVRWLPYDFHSSAMITAHWGVNIELFSTRLVQLWFPHLWVGAVWVCWQGPSPLCCSRHQFFTSATDTEHPTSNSQSGTCQCSTGQCESFGRNQPNCMLLFNSQPIENYKLLGPQCLHSWNSCYRSSRSFVVAQKPAAVANGGRCGPLPVRSTCAGKLTTRVGWEGRSGISRSHACWSMSSIFLLSVPPWLFSDLHQVPGIVLRRPWSCQTSCQKVSKNVSSRLSNQQPLPCAIECSAASVDTAVCGG